MGFSGKLLGEGYKTVQDLKLTTKHSKGVLDSLISLNDFVQASRPPNRADLAEEAIDLINRKTKSYKRVLCKGSPKDPIPNLRAAVEVSEDLKTPGPSKTALVCENPHHCAG